MKKDILDFTKVRYFQKRGRLPKMARFARSSCYLTGGETVTEEDEVKAIKAIGEQVTKFTELLGDKADKKTIEDLVAQVKALETGIETMKADDISKMLKDINDGNEKLWKQVVEIQEEQAKAKEEGTTKDKRGPIVARKDVEAFVKATFGEKSDRGYTGDKTGSPAKIEIKAAEIFGYADFFDGGANTQIDAFTGRFVDPTLYQRKRKRNLILDNFTIRTIGVPKLIYLIKVEDGTDADSLPGDSGGADWILSGEIKPLRSFRVTTGEVTAKKVAIFSTAEDKLLRDVDSLDMWIREDLMDEMREKINDGLLNNNPAVDPDAPLGMKTNATTFTPTAAFLDTFAATQSTYIDQLTAIFAMMANNREEADRAFVTWDIYYRILVLKSTTLEYLNNNLVYTNSLGQLFISGVPIIPSDVDDIPATHVLVTGVDLGFKMYAYGPLVFERGLNGEDFRYDRTSYRAYQEFLSFIPENRENSVVYDTWANVKAGIEAA